MGKIAAVVVTYNRKDLLRNCLISLLNQSVELCSVVVVDNASTDGTDEMMKRYFSKNAVIDYMKLNNNTGGAGGYYYGMKRAFERGYDWIFVVDDDVQIEKNAVEVLLKYEDVSKFIIGRRKNINDKIYPWLHFFDYRTGKKPKLDENKYFKKHDYVEVNVGCFEGALIHREVITDIGYPRKDYFIGEDDTIYGFKASLNHNVIYIKDVILTRLFGHKNIFIGRVVLPKISPVYLYHLVRNQFYLECDVKKLFPNEIINHRKKIYFFTTATFLYVLFFTGNKSRMFKALFNGLRDGRKYAKSYRR